MKLYFAVFALFVLGASAADFPEKFLGKWTVGKSENFDEYLTEKGYSWFTRQLVKVASITKIFEKAGPGRMNVKIDTTSKDVEWNNVPFGEEFEGEYIDGAKHKIKFYEQNGKLFEDHHPIGEGEAKAELYSYELEDPKTIIMYMTEKGVTAKRWYNKE